MNIREVIGARAAMVEAVRAFFRSEGFAEVSTPAALPHPNLDPNVRPLPLEVAGMDGNRSRFWLHTSPEIAMKKLLAAGSGNIYQVSSVFRDGEFTPVHRQEFAMLEWYRVGAGYREAMADTVNVIRAVCRAVGGGEIVSGGGREMDLGKPWANITMAEAFHRFAGVSDFNTDKLPDALHRAGIAFGPEEQEDELFMRLYVEKVEPQLGREGPVIVRDFPAFLGTMAAPVAGAPELLERFEVYIAGLELANGYTELTDPAELGRRMSRVKDRLEAQGVTGLTVDAGFIDAVAHMPPCGGVSVGLDRLLMLLLGSEDIGEVVYPYGMEW